MLFQKNIEPRCVYCARSAQMDEKNILCAKRGVRSAGDHCGAFRYDPLKRVPPRPSAPNFSKLKEEDFAI